ncbi:MAG: hypothetical protein ACXVB5_23140, partial [Isosphaeraceae bacterium]
MRRSLPLRLSLLLAVLLALSALGIVSPGRPFGPSLASALSASSTWAVVGDYGSGDANAAAVAK